MSRAFFMTWRESGVLHMQPLAARTLTAAWDAAFGVAQAKGWPACCSFGICRTGGKARA